MYREIGNAMKGVLGKDLPCNSSLLSEVVGFTTIPDRGLLYALRLAGIYVSQKGTFLRLIPAPKPLCAQLTCKAVAGTTVSAQDTARPRTCWTVGNNNYGRSTQGDFRSAFWVWIDQDQY